MLAAHNEKQEAEKRERSWRHKIWRRIRHGSVTSKDELDVRVKEKKHKEPLSKAGLDVESGIPPDGKRIPLGSS